MQNLRAPPGGLRDEYALRLKARRAARADRERKKVILGNLRVAVSLVAVAMTFAAVHWQIFSGWWLLLPAVVFLWLGARLQHALTGHAALSRAAAFYERALARLDGRWSGTGESGSRFVDEHHIYARDLDMFGSGSLFELLCNARTRMGEETLAAWLLAPAAPDVVRARQKAAAELAPRLDLREDLAVLGENARPGVQPEALIAWGNRPPLLESSPFRTVAWGLSFFGAIAAVALITYLLTQLRILELPEKILALMRLYFLCIAIIFGAILWRFKKRTDRIIGEVQEAAHDLGLLAGILKRLEAERFTSPHLSALRAELDIQGWPPSRRIAQLNRLIELLDSGRRHMVIQMIGPLLLWELHLSYALEDWRRTSGPTMGRWLTAVGEMEALASLAGYCYEHPADVFPEFTAESPCFEGEALSHPLLAENCAVPNDIHIGRELPVLVVSGSNMSGKSTLLRTVGISAVLAQAGAPVRARRLRLSPLAVGASIRIQDSLRESTSRFYAEITRLRRIMEQTASAPPVLFLIDEFLHGTNSHDRRIGAEAIVRGLVDRGGIGLVTTHDLALARIADALSPRGANVHFEDYLENGRIHFDYRMRPGVVRKSNAIELMRAVGLNL